MSVINIANTVSLTRVIIVPVFIITIVKGMRYVPLILFVISSLTDAIDGYIARHLSQNHLGKYLDPICDKILLISSYITLTILRYIPVWFLVVVLARDIIVFIGWLVTYFMKKYEEQDVNWLGKTSTCMQMITIIIVLFARYIKIPNLQYIFHITAILTILSALEYYKRFLATR